MFSTILGSTDIGKVTSICLTAALRPYRGSNYCPGSAFCALNNCSDVMCVYSHILDCACLVTLGAACYVIARYAVIFALPAVPPLTVTLSQYEPKHD